MGSTSRTHQRTLSIVLAVTMLVTVVPPTAQAGHSTSDDWPAYADDFQGFYSGFPLDCTYSFYSFCNKWKEYTDLSPSRYYTATEGDNIYVANPAKYGYTDSTAHLTPRHHDSYLSNSFEGSFRAKMRASTNTSWTTSVFLTDSSKIDDVTGAVYWWQGAAIVRLSSTGQVAALGSTGYQYGSFYNANEWVTVDIDFHSNGTYDVCIGGKPSLRHVPFYSAPTTGVNTIGLFAGGSTYRTVDTSWDDLMLVPTPQDFCLDTDPAPVEQDFWNFTGVGDLYTDDQIRMAAVESFFDCTQQVNAARSIYYPYHGCPHTVAEWETIIRDKIADTAAQQNDILPDIERPTNEAPTPIAKPTPRLDYLDGVVVDALATQLGPDFPWKSAPPTVDGPALPGVPEAAIEPPRDFPVLMLPPGERGPELPAVPTVEFSQTGDFTLPAWPDVQVEPVAFTPPEVPGTTEVVVPLRDHGFEMNWTVSMSHEKLLELLMPTVPTLPEVTGGVVDTVGEAVDAAESPSSSRSPHEALHHHPGAELPPPTGTSAFEAWVEERQDLIDFLNETWNVPDYRDQLLLPPLVFEIHTESRGQIKRTPALPLVPALINVDNNPTTGLLGYDIAVTIGFTPLLNEVRMNVTRLAPWERNAPDLWGPLPDDTESMMPSDAPLPSNTPAPAADAIETAYDERPNVTFHEPYPDGAFPGSPLDLTAYVIMPIPAPWPAETMLTQNPEQILVGAAGFTTQGNDAPASAEVVLAADSLLPLHPNSRMTLTLRTQDALDNFTLFGGVADSLMTGAEEHDLGELLAPALDAAATAYDDAVGGPIPVPDPGQFAYSLLINSTAYRTGYQYEADKATLASVDFQPPPAFFSVDVSLATQTDSNQVVRFLSETSSDVRVVITESDSLLSEPVRDVVNVRADKFPASLLITLHDDPYLPATEIGYQAEHPIGRIHVVTGSHVVFPEDNQSLWQPGGVAIDLEHGRAGSADEVFHLNVSDLPGDLTFRTDNGDIRLEASQPVGRVAVTSASGARPILPAAGDGLHLEMAPDLTRIGFVLQGLESFRAITSQPATTLRWEMLGDRTFNVNISLDDGVSQQIVKAHVTNLPPVLMLATDAVSFVELETSDRMRGIDAYVLDTGSGFEALINVEDLPEALASRFNFTGGKLSFLAAQPVGEIRALARLPTPDLESVRLRIVNLPSFDVSWQVDGGISATFDAGGDGIGLLEFQGGGQSLLSIPALASDDHVFMMEGAHPDAPLALGARMTGLKHVSATVDDDSYRFRAEHKRPQNLTLVIDTLDLDAFGVIEAVPTALSVHVDLSGDMTAVYEATEVIERITMWVRHGTMEGQVDVRLIPTRIDIALTGDAATGMRGLIRNQGRLGSLDARLRDSQNLFGTPWTSAYARLEGVPEEVIVSVREGGVGFEASPGALSLVEAAVTNGPALRILEGDHVYLRGDAAGDTVEASARITGLTYFDAAFDSELSVRVENERARPFVAHVDYPHLGVLGQVNVADLPGTLSIQTNLHDRHTYEASSVIGRIDAYASISGLEAWLGLEDVPARVKVVLNQTATGIEGHVISSSRLHELRADVYDPAFTLGTPWQRAYVKVQGLPEVLSFSANGVGSALQAEFGTEHDPIALVEGAASSTPGILMLPEDHVMYGNVSACGLGSYSGDLIFDGPVLIKDDGCGYADVLSFRLRGLEGARASVSPAGATARLETADERSFTALVNLPDFYAYANISNVPEVVEFRTDYQTEHVYTASTIINSIRVAAGFGTTYVDALARGIPASVHVTLEPVPAGLEVQAVSSSRLTEFRVHGYDEAGIFGTPWTEAYARVAGVPERVALLVGQGGARFDATPQALDVAEAAIALAPGDLRMLPGDHVQIETNATGEIVRASARITGLQYASANFTDAGFSARLETTRALPFTAVAKLVDQDVDAYVRVQDLPATLAIDSNLRDRHLYEASSIISRIDAYGRQQTTQAWLGLDDVPARVKVLVNATENATEGFILSSSRLQEVRADLFDPNGLAGTNWTRVYAKAQGIPEVLSFRADDAGAEFGTEHALVALVEGAATTAGATLPMLAGDHVAYVDAIDWRTCEEQKLCEPEQSASFRLRGLEGARVGFSPDGLEARLETRDGRNFTAYAQTPDLTACLVIEPLPTLVHFVSDLATDHVYDASQIIANLELDADVNGTYLHLGLKDLPTHIHVLTDVQDDSGKIRLWMNEVLRDVLFDAYAPEGIGGTEWKRVRAHVEHVPQELAVDFSATGTTLTTGGDQIGLVEFWAATDYALNELAGDHLRYQDVCVSGGQDGAFYREVTRIAVCGKSASGRLTGLVSASYNMTDADGLRAHLDTRGPRVFRILYEEANDYERTNAQVVIDQLPAQLSFRTDLDTRYVYDASSPVDAITLRGGRYDNETWLSASARLLNLPARVEVTQLFDDTGGHAAYITDSPLGLIEMEVTDGFGLHDTNYTRFVGRIKTLPQIMELHFNNVDGHTGASITTNGQGIGLVEAGVTTEYALPVTFGNGVYLDQDGVGTETATARIRGFTGANVRLVDDAVSANLQMLTAAPFEAVANTAGVEAYVLIKDVPASLSVSAELPSKIVYSASSPIESILVYVDQPLGELGTRTLRADVTTLPATMRVSIDEVNGIAHIDSSEAIGGIKLQIWDPEMTIGFHNVYADIRHVPANVRVRWQDPFQVDLSEGVDTIVFKATAMGTYPVFAGNHAVVRDLTDLKGDDRRAISVEAGALKFAEAAIRDGYTLVEARFRESQNLRAYYEKVDPYGAPIEEYVLNMTNVPKDIKFQLIEGLTGTQGTILYDASERVGGLDFAMIRGVDDYYDLSFADLPSELEVNWRFGTDTPWYIRYVSDAPTEVDFTMPTSLGPLGLQALVQNVQFSILEVPGLVPDVSIDVDVSLLPPDVSINLDIEWTFVLGTDTDFLPNHMRLTLGLFHSDDFDLAVTFTGDLTAQDWLYEASIRVRIGTDTGIDFPIDTVGGHAYAKLCAGIYVRYDPLGVDETFDCVLELGGTYS